MIILIDGWSGSGHSVLRGLLDGHPNLFCSPIHDYIPVAFFEDLGDPIWYEYKDYEQLRRILAAKSGYYRVERYASNKKFPFDYAKDQRGYIDIDFDFYEFDKRWSQKILQYEKWTPELICETIYDSMMQGFCNYPIPRENIQHYVALGQPPPTDPVKFFDKFPNGKLLYMNRDVEGLVASHVTRKPIPGEYGTLNRSKRVASKRIAEGLVETIIEKHKLLEEFAKRNPEKAKIVYFKQLVENPTDTMHDVADFLNIPFTDHLTYFSVLGKERLTGAGKKYIGKILDSPEDLLSKEDLFAICLKKRNATSYLLGVFSNPVFTVRIIYRNMRFFLGRIFHKVRKLIKIILE